MNSKHSLLSKYLISKSLILQVEFMKNIISYHTKERNITKLIQYVDITCLFAIQLKYPKFSINHVRFLKGSRQTKIPSSN